MKTIIKLSGLLSLLLVLWTCSEDFLDTPPQGSLDASALTQQEGIERVLISAYARVDGWADDWGTNPWGFSGSNWIFGSVVSDDAHKGSEPADGITIGELELFQWLPNNDNLQGKFIAVYDGIRRTNETLALLDANEDIAQADRDRIEGEARFLRAHYHMEAWKMWKNVPYFDQTDTDFRKPNDQDIFPLIVADFEAAASKLPASQADIGRATSGAANAMLGRLHMLNGDMAAASTALNRVTGYELSDCFHDMFSTAGENGPEMIFSVQASVNDGSGGSDNGNFADRLAFPHAGSPFGCCGLHQPSQNLVNAYRTTQDGLPLNSNAANDNPTVDEPVDPRLDWTVGRDGVPYLDWGTHDPSWIRSRSYAGPYSPRKFAHISSEASNVGWNGNHLTPVNVPIIRYADVILMQAEIDVENNRLEDARAKVNLIRNRAAACAQGTGAEPVPLNDPSITHATYRVGPYTAAWTDQAVAREAVRLERRLELAMEGHRWFDLRRYGTQFAINTMNEYLSVESTRRTFLAQTSPIQERHMLFPIPTTAILTSQVDGSPTLRQNPGY